MIQPGHTAPVVPDGDGWRLAEEYETPAATAVVEKIGQRRAYMRVEQPHGALLIVPVEQLTPGLTAIAKDDGPPEVSDETEAESEVGGYDASDPKRGF